MDDLSTVLDALKLELSPAKSRAAKSFSRLPLSEAEVKNELWSECYTCGAQVTDYQYRALAILGDKFYFKAVRKYPPEHHTFETCLLVVAEYQPMFNEIHRAVAHYIKAEGLTIGAALDRFINQARKSRKVVEDESF